MSALLKTAILNSYVKQIDIYRPQTTKQSELIGWLIAGEMCDIKVDFIRMESRILETILGQKLIKVWMVSSGLNIHTLVEKEKIESFKELWKAEE